MDLTQKCVLTDEMSKLVAETMRESLFDYAFDSDKVPSLNLHFFLLRLSGNPKFS